MSKIYIVLRNSKWTEKRPVSMGNGFFKELVPVITSFVKLTKKRNANQFIINQLASQVVDYYDKLSNLLDAIRALNVASRELSGSFFVAGRDR